MVQPSSDVRTIGSYRIYDVIGSGGMGSVHLGRLFGSGGFRRMVAIKRLHPHRAEDVEFVSAFLDEARLASRIHHPNVVAPLDVVAADGEVFLVLEYVPGVSLAKLKQLAASAGESLPVRIAVSIMVDVLSGLQAAHEATGDGGEPLDLIHRDVSPENILLGKDGSARLLDFGVAKASGRLQVTTDGVVKGKRGYMAPEQVLGQSCRESDLYSTAVVLLELLTERRLYVDDRSLSDRLAGKSVEWPADAREINPQLQASVLRGLAFKPRDRFCSAREMSQALEGAGLATAREIGDWVVKIADVELRDREARVARAEALGQAEGSSPSRVPATAPSDLDAALGGASAVFDESGSARTTNDAAKVPFARRRGIIAVALACLFVIVVPASLYFARSNDAHVLAARSHAIFGSPLRSSEPKTPAPLWSDTPQIASSRALPPTSDAGKVRPLPTSRTRSQKPCKPYVLDKDGRTRFNEECLR